MEADIETLKENSNDTKVDGRGGAREGAGRPKGGENEETARRRLAERAYKERVVAHIHDLFNSQLALSKGLSYLYRIDETEDDKGKKIRKHVLVESPTEINDVLDELDGSSSGTCEDNYYYITTKAPDNRAIDSMMDRVFGKAKQSTVLEDPEGNAITFVVAEVIARKNNIDGNTNA